MFHRCYYESQQKKVATYLDVEVCEDWWTFANFKKWYDIQIPGEDLDKDLKVFGSNIYSPETCFLVPREVNGFIIGLSKPRGKYAKGVVKYENRYQKCWKSQINLGKGSVSLGWFYTELEAHKRWQIEKSKRALELAEKQNNPEVAQRLEIISYNLLRDNSSSSETLSLKGMNNV